jgi:hypothetical protein
MPDYMKMYFQLAAKVADAIDILQKALQQGENDFMEGEAQIIRIAAAKEETDDHE